MRDIAQRSLYPDTTYGISSGGDPKAIPDLTYQQFKKFHQTYYHPSNTRAFFSGDDDAGQQRNACAQSDRHIGRKHQVARRALLCPEQS